MCHEIEHVKIRILYSIPPMHGEAERCAGMLVPAFSWDDTTMLRPWFTGSKLKIYYKI